MKNKRGVLFLSKATARIWVPDLFAIFVISEWLVLCESILHSGSILHNHLLLLICCGLFEFCLSLVEILYSPSIISWKDYSITSSAIIEILRSHKAEYLAVAPYFTLFSLRPFEREIAWWTMVAGHENLSKNWREMFLSAQNYGG